MCKFIFWGWPFGVMPADGEDVDGAVIETVNQSVFL